MVEEYDDAERREVRKCPYCIPAIKGGPIVGDRWHVEKKLLNVGNWKPGMPSSEKVKHWVRVTDIENTSKHTINSMEVWTLDAACGATFKTFVDSSD